MRRLTAAGFAAFLLCAPAEARAQGQVNSTTEVSPARDSGTDVALGVGVMRDSDKHAFVGGRGTVALNLSDALAVIAEAGWLFAAAERVSGGRMIRDVEQTAMGGIRLRKFIESTAVPYLQISAGYSGRYDNGLRVRRSLFASRTEVGLDVGVSKYLGMRAGLGWTFLFADEPYRNQFSGTIALTLAMGHR